MLEAIIDHTTVEEVVQAVFSTTLAIDCRIGESKEPEPQIQGTVAISGTWNGEIAVALPRQLATTAASRMFNIDRESVSADDVLDAVGELSNQVAGTIKSVLAPECTLDIPRSESIEAGVSQDTQGSTRHWFDAQGQSFSVIVSQNPSASAHSAEAGNSDA